MSGNTPAFLVSFLYIGLLFFSGCGRDANTASQNEDNQVTKVESQVSGSREQNNANPNPENNSDQEPVEERETSTDDIASKIIPGKKEPAHDERNVLVFNGHDSYIETSSMPFDSFESFTIEAWIKEWEKRLVYQGQEGDPENSIWLTWGSPGWSVGWESGDGANFTFKLESDSKSEWEHIAMVFDGTKQYVYLNGKLLQEIDAPKPGPLVPERPLFIGAQQKWDPAQHGEAQRTGSGILAGVKISSRALYTGTVPFEPPEKFTADEQTELLYDLTKPGGTALQDRSKHNRHGMMYNVIWAADSNSPGKSD